MKTLIKTVHDIPWLPKPGVGRLYITDEQPPREISSTAFGFVFDNDRVLLTHLRDRRRDWDLPGGVIDPGETAAQAAVREVWEETGARVKVIEMLGTQELELFGPKPERYRWPYPVSIQTYFLCRLVELCPLDENSESFDRGFFAPDQARAVPTMVNHDGIYEEGLRRAQLLAQRQS